MPTPSVIHGNDFKFLKNASCFVGTAHDVIGQEFSNVALIIDNNFYYENGVLLSKPYYNNVYNPRNMAYQAATRVIDKLEVIIVNNLSVFNSLISLFND